MARLLVHVEGQTEETFVNEILRDHLLARGYHSVGARLLGKARQRARRGGIRSWPGVKGDIMRHLQEDPACIATTMVDYYGLPREGDSAWPGRAQAHFQPAGNKAQAIEKALLEDLAQTMGSAFNRNRFLPFVLMHEFEALLFSDCTAFSRAIQQPELETAFSAIRSQYPTPEEINDGPATAPSKRIRDLAPRYEKPLYGILAALEIGLACMRRECSHFDRWIHELEERALR